jgi:predicted nucleic acid-binding protein
VSGLVLDASSALSWCFEDEDESFADDLVDIVAATGAVVSNIWPLEITNALVVAERRERITVPESASFLTLIQELPITIDGGTASHAFGQTVDLARRHGLSTYDASYLELALRMQLPLATLDKVLRVAATDLGIDAPA